MPKMDGTGPMGQGERTGRDMGPCGGGIKMGCCSCRQGWCAGFRRFFRSPKNQLQDLKEEEKNLNEKPDTVKAEKETIKAQK